MKLCRFQIQSSRPRVGLVLDENTILDLSAEGIDRISSLLEFDGLISQLASLAGQNLPRHALSDVRLLAPVEQQEVWAVGVTYLRSKKARMEESDFSATAYDKVYDAPRPELFFKALPEKVVAPGDTVGIRRDAKWNVPEPELTFVINSRGHIAGYTIGNDMSSRDIEGETSVGQIKRSFEELVGYLFRSQTFPHGAVLLTGTGIVPPDGFTLRTGDRIQIGISGIGLLENAVVEV